MQLTVTTFDDVKVRGVDVVGESFYQDFLMEIGGGRTPEGVAVRNHVALLIPEPKNPKDKNAVKVWIRQGEAGMTAVGYLDRKHATAYRPVFELLAPRVMQVDAYLTGGWDRGKQDQGSIGVRLMMATPAALEAAIWAERSR